MFAKKIRSGECFRKVLSSVTISPDTRGRKADPEEKYSFLKKIKTGLCEQGMNFFTIAFETSYIFFSIDMVPMPAVTRFSQLL